MKRQLKYAWVGEKDEMDLLSKKESVDWKGVDLKQIIKTPKKLEDKVIKNNLMTLKIWWW